MPHIRRAIVPFILLIGACAPPSEPVIEDPGSDTSVPNEDAGAGPVADANLQGDSGSSTEDASSPTRDMGTADAGVDATGDASLDLPDMAPPGRPRPADGLGHPWVADGTPDPGLPAQVACGECDAGAFRCLSDIDREECRDDGSGCFTWTPAASCDAAAFCQRNGSCGPDNPCKRLNEVEKCDARGSIRSCVETPDGVVPSEARACDPDSPPPHCDTREQLGVISFGTMRAGSCVQVNSSYGTTRDDGTLVGLEPHTDCGPCSWHQCVVGPDGVGRFECRSAFDGQDIDWTAIPRELSPPTDAYGYTCSDLEGKPVQSNSKIKRGGSNAWTVSSHYQGAGCPVRRDWK